MKRSIAVLLTAGGFAVASLLATPVARAADVLTLTSPAIQDNGTLATKNACSDKERSPNCVGENISPPLAWSNVPDGTKSFALLLFDPEGRAPAGVSHMVVYGIPADVKGFAEGELSQPSDKFCRREAAGRAARPLCPSDQTGGSPELDRRGRSHLRAQSWYAPLRLWRRRGRLCRQGRCARIRF